MQCHIRRVQPTRCDVSQVNYSCKTLYMFQTGFPSIIRSTKLHIQRQVFVRPILLPAGSRPGQQQVAVTSSSSSSSSSSYSSSSSSSVGTTAHCGLWPVEKCPSILSYLGASNGLTNTWRCMCSFELLMMDGGFPCFPSVVRQMLGYSSQRRGTDRILTSAQSRVNGLLYVLLVLIVVVICNFGL